MNLLPLILGGILVNSRITAWLVCYCSVHITCIVVWCPFGLRNNKINAFVMRLLHVLSALLLFSDKNMKFGATHLLGWDGVQKLDTHAHHKT